MPRTEAITCRSGPPRRGRRAPNWLLWNCGAEEAVALPGLTPRAPYRFWHKCSAARRWSATCPAYRERCGTRCAPGAQPAGQSTSMRPPKPSPSGWLRASYWGYSWMRRNARSCPELSSSLWRTSSRCPWMCPSAACARY